MPHGPKTPRHARLRATPARRNAGVLRSGAIAALLVVSFVWSQGVLTVPVPLSDPLGLGDGVVVVLGRAAEERGIGTQAGGGGPSDVVGSFPKGSEVIRMPPMRPADFPLGVPPSHLDVTTRFGDVLVLRLPSAQLAGDYPARIVTASAVIASIRIEDDGETQPVTLGPFESEGGASTTWTRTDRCEAQRCAYRIADDASLPSILISVQGEELSAALDVLGNEATPNRLTGRMTLALDTDLPDGASIEMTLLAPSGTAYF